MDSDQSAQKKKIIIIQIIIIIIKIIIMIIMIIIIITLIIVIVIIKETRKAVPKAAKLSAVFHFNTSMLMSFQDLFLLKCVDSKTFARKSKNFEAHRRALTHAQI